MRPKLRSHEYSDAEVVVAVARAASVPARVAPEVARRHPSPNGMTSSREIKS